MKSTKFLWGISFALFALVALAFGAGMIASTLRAAS